MRIDMVHLRAMGSASIIGGAILLGPSFVRSSAQALPIAPAWPTEDSQCESFNRDLDAYEAAYVQKHAECLASNKADNPDETSSDSTVCSRSACQYLHDELFADSSISVKTLKRELPKCYERVRENQAEAAREEERAAKRKANEAEEEMQVQQEKDNRKKQDQDAQDAEEKRHAEQSEHRVIRRNAEAEEQPLAAQGDSEKNNEDRQLLVDPFAGSESSGLHQSDVVASAKITDPFPPKDELVDPFGASSPSYTSTTSSEAQKEFFEATSRTIEHSTKAVASQLDHDIAQIDKTSGITMSPAKARQSIAEIKDTKSLIQSLSSFVTAGQYAILIKNVYSAETPAQREQAEGEVGKQIVSDALRTDLVNEGIKTVAPRVFGKTVGLVVAGAAPLAIESGGILFDSVKTDRDPTEVIRDSGGNVSLAEKQQALVQMWHGYERMQSQTANGQRSSQLKQELWINTNIVYHECLEVKANCDAWKPVTKPK
jgi:hypothetical protein